MITWIWCGGVHIQPFVHQLQYLLVESMQGDIGQCCIIGERRKERKHGREVLSQPKKHNGVKEFSCYLNPDVVTMGVWVDLCLISQQWTILYWCLLTLAEDWYSILFPGSGEWSRPRPLAENQRAQPILSSSTVLSGWTRFDITSSLIIIHDNQHRTLLK